MLIAAFTIACVAVRVAWLRFDPPAWLSWSSGVYTDEGFYTLDARSWALFGTSAAGNFHDALTAPLLSGLQRVWFAEYGSDLISARMLSAVMSVAALLLFWRAVRRLSGPLAGDAAAVLLGLAPPLVFYNCLALQETPALFFIVLALWLVAVGKTVEKPAWTCAACALAGIALVCAFLCKTLALLAAPSIALACLMRRSTTSRTLSTAGENGVGLISDALGDFVAFPGGFAVAFAIWAALWLRPHHTEIARMSGYYLRQQILPHTARSLWLDVRRAAIDRERGLLPYLLAFLPVQVVLAVWSAFTKQRKATPLLVRDGRLAAGRSAMPFIGVDSETVAILWLLCSVAFCALSRYAPSRYYVLLLPALCWCGAVGWTRISSAKLRAATLAAATLVSLGWIGNAWMHRDTSLVTASADIGALVAPRGIVLGEFAPALCLDTPFRAAPLQPGLSNDVRPIETLRPDYVTVCRSPYWEGWWQARYPWLVTPERRVTTVVLGDKYTVDVYRVH